MAERERFSKQLIDEILNEEGIDELQELVLDIRRPYDEAGLSGYKESDNDFLARGHNLKAAAILLEIYLRTRPVDL